MKDLLIESLHYEVEKLMSTCLDIEEFGIEFQNRLGVDTQKDLPIVSPFGYYTHTGFFYTILTNYTLSQRSDMHTVMNTTNGIYSGNTSR